MKTLKKIKQLKEQGLISEKEYNEIKESLENNGIQDLTKGDSYDINNRNIAEQGKLTNKEQKLINKYKDKGVDFTYLLKTIKELENKVKKKD